MFSSSNIHLLTKGPTPVLDRPEFEKVFGSDKLSWDHVGIRALEFIALPGTLFKVVSCPEKWNGRICEVITEDYPSSGKLYIDAKFCEETQNYLPRSKVCPSSMLNILTTMEKMLGLPYVWGGNVHLGVDEMSNFYPMPANLDERERALWCMKGVDCSGMIYEATNGYTPRNTSALAGFGEGLQIEGKSLDEILKLIKPLDSIVWNGHVVSVFDDRTTIESRFDQHGSVRIPIKDRFKEILQTRQPVNDYQACADKSKHFVIRRWFTFNE